MHSVTHFVGIGAVFAYIIPLAELNNVHGNKYSVTGQAVQC